MDAARLTRPLALLFTPAIWLASVHTLYLRNQDELGRAVWALRPFWLAAALAVVAGALLQRADGRAWARALLWSYYAAGWAMLAWGFLRGVSLGSAVVPWVLDTRWGSLAFMAAAALSAAAAFRAGSPRRIEPLLAVLAALFTAREAVTFGRRYERPRPVVFRDLPAEITAAGADRPNVYHLLLDAFADDLFEAALPRGSAGAFDGFVRFPATESAATATALSLPSILTSRPPRSDVKAAMKTSLHDADSLLSRVAAAGYQRVGFLPRSVYAESGPPFEHVIFHDENVAVRDAQEMQARVFRRLWFFSVAPVVITQPLARQGVLGVDAEFLRSVKAQRASTSTQPVESRLSFERAIEMEARLPARGRYTLIHVLLPHNPYLVAGDCSFGSDAHRTDLRQQSECALRLAARFVETLRRLGRFEEATIVIHGDHGSVVEHADGTPPDRSAEYRTLLLFKASGASGPLRRSADHARLLDLTPTLLAALRLPPLPGAEGHVLQDALRPAAPP
jgi:hypothetical protein